MAVFAYTQERYLIFFFFLKPSNCSNHIRDIVYSAVEWKCSPGDLDLPSPPYSPSPGHSIVLDPAPVIRFSESTIMATLIKVPSPDPFPEWNLLPLPQSWDNGPCYSGEQGPTVSRLLAYSPGLIILNLWGTVLLGKALALGGPGGELKFPCWCRDKYLHMDQWENNGKKWCQYSIQGAKYHLHKRAFMR